MFYKPCVSSGMSVITSAKIVIGKTWNISKLLVWCCSTHDVITWLNTLLVGIFHQSVRNFYFKLFTPNLIDSQIKKHEKCIPENDIADAENFCTNVRTLKDVQCNVPPSIPDSKDKSMKSTASLHQGREVIQWRPIQMRAFHSNENGLFYTHPLAVAPLFWWKERGKQGSAHLNEKFSFE